MLKRIHNQLRTFRHKKHPLTVSYPIGSMGIKKSWFVHGDPVYVLERLPLVGE
jgi:hypothetical protein